MRRYDYDFSPNVYINLSEYGAPGYHEISQLEMRMLYTAAETITSQYNSAQQVQWLESSHTRLCAHAQAQAQAVCNDWIGLAVLCLAVRGIRYGEIPDCVFALD